MKMPTTEQIDIAVSWLYANEGDNIEAGACKAVAEWLGHEQLERSIRTAARQAGVTTGTFRRRLMARSDP